MDGPALHEFASRLYPICRSITGHGVRQTLALIREYIPLEIREVPTGATAYDWEVPLEWNIEDARVEASDGSRVVDFRAHNLHLVSYSEPVSRTVSLAELDERLHSRPDHPTWILYRTCYYRRSWGFCLRHDVRQTLMPGQYRVEIKSSLAPGSLTYGEWSIPGRMREDVLFFTHTYHPSLANDNTSAMAIATALAAWIASEPRRHSYQFVFAPGAIGSSCWLREVEDRLRRVHAGLLLVLLEDPGALTYKMSRTGNALTDGVPSYAVSQTDGAGKVIPFAPYGSDERQLCSPDFNLPIGRLKRSVNNGDPQYHTSADDLERIRPECLAQSLDACKLFVTVLENDARYVNRCPKGEPRLGKCGLYGAVGGQSPAAREEAMLWVLNQSDGSHSLMDIGRRERLSFGIIHDAAMALKRAGLLEQEKAGHIRPATNVGRAGSRRKGGKR